MLAGIPVGELIFVGVLSALVALIVSRMTGRSSAYHPIPLREGAEGRVGGDGKVAVRDSQGRIRISLGMMEDALPALTFLDEQGQIRAVMGLVQSGEPTIELISGNVKANLCVKGDDAGLSLKDANGTNRVVLSSGPGEMSHLSLTDSAGESRLVFTITPTGSAEIWMMDAAGEKRVNVAVDKGGGSAVAIADRNGVPRIGMGTGDDGDAKFVVFDSKGEVSWATPKS